MVIRRARRRDSKAIETLIACSARTLGAADYTKEQIELALLGVWGLDTSLVSDGTYFVAENRGQIVGCGGWSRRNTLFGGDALANRDDAPLDPATDAARIRAFFVHPDFARQGIASQILTRCETEAAAEGFRRLELGATLPGMRLYRRFDYIAGEAYEYECAPGKYMTIVPMSKTIEANTT